MEADGLEGADATTDDRAGTDGGASPDDPTAAGRAGEQWDDPQLRERPPDWPALGVLVSWMLATLALTGATVALLAEVTLVAVAALAGSGLLVGIAGVPLLLYDGGAASGTVAGEGFRFDVLPTAVALALVYPLGAPIYAMVRFQGPFMAARDVDPRALDVGGELEFVLEDLVHPAADGVPSTWPAWLVLGGWVGVVLGDAFLLGALLVGETGLIVGAAAAAAVLRLLGVVALVVDLSVVTTTGGFGAREAVAWGVATAVLYPLAAVAYLPHRLHRSYG